MKYYSDVTKKFYESEKECLEAEKARKKEQKQKRQGAEIPAARQIHFR